MAKRKKVSRKPPATKAAAKKAAPKAAPTPVKKAAKKTAPKKAAKRPVKKPAADESILRMGPRTRAADAARKLAERQSERDIPIPRPKDPARRAQLLEDSYDFLSTCFPRVFSQPFTPSRREMGDAIVHAGRHGGDIAVAGPRGDGKTRLALFKALWLILRRELRFPIMISKSGGRAARELKNLKEAIRDSDQLAAYFPEIVVPIRAIGGWASRARQQTVGGEFTHLEWGSDCVVLPTIATATLRKQGWPKGVESAAAGQVLASLGIEGPIRGYNVRNERPDLAILDDIDDRESAESESLTDDRVHIIEEDVGGLAGPDRSIARVMLCTLINRTCIAAIYTDREKRPSWRGLRIKLLERMPTSDLADEYIARRQQRTDEDPDAREAHRFYVTNQEEIEADAVTTNPYRFDSRPHADGLPAEVSAVQACLNLIADRGREFFDTEYNNSPPELQGPVESGLTAERIQRQLSGFERCKVPPDVVMVTAGVDVGKYYVHWVVVGWTADASGYILAYDSSATSGASYGTDEGLDLAIHRGVLGVVEQLRGLELDGAGDAGRVALTLVDSSYRTDAVYAACAEARLGVMPVMGVGKSEDGAAKTSFNPVTKITPDKRPGDRWFLTKVGKDFWLVMADSDRWKSWVADRWMTAADKPGRLSLYGKPGEDGKLSTDAKAHRQFADSASAEVECEEMIRNKLVRHWKRIRKDNHYGDCLYYAAVAANIKGVRLPIAATAKTTAPDRLPGQRPPAASVSIVDLAAQAKARGG